MSRIFGEMRQIAFVVRDLEKALDYWTRTLGVGPFFVMRDVVPDNYRYRGRPVPPPRPSSMSCTKHAMKSVCCASNTSSPVTSC